MVYYYGINYYSNTLLYITYSNYDFSNYDFSINTLLYL